MVKRLLITILALSAIQADMFAMKGNKRGAFVAFDDMTTATNALETAQQGIRTRNKTQKIAAIQAQIRRLQEEQERRDAEYALALQKKLAQTSATLLLTNDSVEDDAEVVAMRAKHDEDVAQTNALIAVLQNTVATFATTVEVDEEEDVEDVVTHEATVEGAIFMLEGRALTADELEKIELNKQINSLKATLAQMQQERASEFAALQAQVKAMQQDFKDNRSAKKARDEANLAKQIKELDDKISLTTSAIETSSLQLAELQILQKTTIHTNVFSFALAASLDYVGLNSTTKAIAKLALEIKALEATKAKLEEQRAALRAAFSAYVGPDAFTIDDEI